MINAADIIIIHIINPAKINSLSRKGVIDKAGTKETFGLLDELRMDYSGNIFQWLNMHLYSYI